MKKVLIAAAFAFATIAPLPALAQAPSGATQALSACITHATTAADDIVLMRWIFVAMSRHPSVAQMANVTDAQHLDANRQMGALFNRLLIHDCPTEARAAFQAEGEEAMRAPFQTLGSRAMGELMANPDVNAGIAEIGAYLDQPGLSAVIGPAATPQAQPQH